ncbi:MAG TPA: imidazole glycerol phosphate synthase subunit HisH [Thermohalobaculum sp.]|nr:imidazole glycerol phosphate synthase subunit HisH [Thermohalobaculum sp.]
MTTAIVDYGSGNLRSAEKALQRVAADTAERIVVTDDPDAVAGADRVVLPGVGAFADCRRGLEALDGMVEALEAHVGAGKPFLGICVGMQLMAREGLEHGVTPGFGWIGGRVVPIEPADPALKVPHMGWNALTVLAEHPVLAGIGTGAHAYFVHSYHVVTDDPADRLAEVDHGGPVAAVIGRGTVIGTQFHPEKSQETGLRLLGNFLRWSP